MIEEWRTIEEFPIYSVSNYGRVRNDQRNHILSGGFDRDGYRQVTICFNGEQYNRRICRLVAKAFLPNPGNLPQINHKDENKSNDHVENLEWCSVKYNNNYGQRALARKKSVKCIETGLVYAGVRVAARLLGLQHTGIGLACRKPNRTAGGYHWQYVTQGETMIEYNIYLKKCKCGHRAELIAESIAHAKYDDVGNRTDIWFVDNPFYCARCTECDRETAWVGNIQTAVNDWNEDRIYYDDEDEDDDDEDDDWGWVDAIVHQD